MTFMLDTDTCIRYLTNRNTGVVQRMMTTAPAEILVCDIVKAELYFGAYNSQRREQNLAVLDEFFGQFESRPFDGTAAKVHGRIRAELKAAGTPIGPMDLLIAAITLANDLVLVTHNTREFRRVGGLRLDDWES
jgi:tRNA(fMet)-specific endonuclease VapC